MEHNFETTELGLGVCRNCGVHRTNPQWPIECKKRKKLQDMIPKKKCESDGLSYTSLPSQKKCKNCGQFWIDSQPDPTCHAPQENKGEDCDRCQYTEGSINCYFCGKSRITTTSTPKPGSSWEEEYKEILRLYIYPENAVRTFISQVEATAREEGYKEGRKYTLKDLREQSAKHVCQVEQARILEKIRGMKKYIEPNWALPPPREELSYNTALSDLENFITSPNQTK